MPSAIDREGDGGNNPLNVPEAEKEEQPATQDNSSAEPTNDSALKLEDTVEANNRLNFVPLWMPIAAFGLIVASYIYCDINGIAVNEIRRFGALVISGIFAIACVIMQTPWNK